MLHVCVNGYSALKLLHTLLYMATFCYKSVWCLWQGAERQFNGMIDVYVKTIKSDGFIGLYRGFVISCVGIIVYRGCYFGFYDTLKPLLLGEKAGVLISFCLGYGN